MKKSHEYDSPVLSRLVSVVSVVAICICSVCCCLSVYKMSSIQASAPVASDNGGSSTGGSSTGGSTGGSSTGGSSTGGSSTGGASTGGTQSGEDATGGTSGGDAAEPAGPAKEEVLAKYTEIMDQLKNGVSTYDKLEFQTIGEYDLGRLANVIMPLAQSFLTTEDKAELQNRNDAEQIPIVNNPKGCLLTDASTIKSATMTESGGKTTIVLVLNDEDNPEPARDAAVSPSNVGAVFNPLSRVDIDNTLAGISAVTVNGFNLKYHDCTATLVFDTATGQVESLEQLMNIHIDADVTGLRIINIAGTAELLNTMRINNITYK